MNYIFLSISTSSLIPDVLTIYLLHRSSVILAATGQRKQSLQPHAIMLKITTLFLLILKFVCITSSKCSRKIYTMIRTSELLQLFPCFKPVVFLLLEIFILILYFKKYIYLNIPPSLTRFFVFRKPVFICRQNHIELYDQFWDCRDRLLRTLPERSEMSCVCS